MKKTLKKFYFNMIEVALAMAIIAIGISSILVLFPVGINASKSAIADNNLADIAEYIFGYYKTAKLHDFYSNSSTTTMSTLHGALGTEPSNSDMNGVTWNTNRITDTNLRIPTNNSLQNRVFLYEQFTTLPGSPPREVVDFAAVAKIWSAPIPLSWRPWTTPPPNNTVTSGTVQASDNYALRLYLELSWPADQRYALREKRIFVLDLYNPTRTVQ
ncbi:hypothetical protein [Victivallis vadensis]|uniref:hypothetical protein n=1 Tax=Victivallis vadensis TaxID=172901 RepID=UPI0023F65DC5|nr:hypothetical protein [Victivallis vadensis]